MVCLSPKFIEKDNVFIGGTRSSGRLAYSNEGYDGGGQSDQRGILSYSALLILTEWPVHAMSETTTE